MTVTTIPAPSPHPSTPLSQQRFFTSTHAAEASRFQTAKTSGSRNSLNYVLTLRTNDDHHESMTRLRTIYFPPKLNKLDAHITLFHALPGEKLETDVLPAIRDIVSGTKSYRIRVTQPFRLKSGIGISIADDVEYANKGKHGRNMTRIIHAELRKKWHDWLSDQDSQPVRMHYTVMNKVNDDRIVDSALNQLKESFSKGVDVSNGRFDHEHPPPPAREGEHVTDDEGTERIVTEGLVEGLTLWKYDGRTGHWTEPFQFDFPK